MVTSLILALKIFQDDTYVRASAKCAERRSQIFVPIHDWL